MGLLFTIAVTIILIITLPKNVPSNAVPLHILRSRCPKKYFSDSMAMADRNQQFNGKDIFFSFRDA
jgi:hypothetical protein